MTKRNEQYWKNRVAQRMWEYMQSAEETADEAAKLYQKAAAYLNQEIDGIFEKYMTKHNLSEREAYALIGHVRFCEGLLRLEPLIAKEYR